MSSWIRRIAARFGARGGQRAAIAAKSLAPTSACARPADARSDPAVPAADLRIPFFEWMMVGTGPTLAQPLSARERQLLHHLDQMLAGRTVNADLLPRASALIPQLMSSLRDEGLSIQALARRVERDPALVAEVIRMAGSVHTRAAQPVADLSGAIRRLGMEGLRRAIARVVLKPVFDARGDSLAGRTAPRLWRHSDEKAKSCAVLSTAAGVPPFEAYLAGLMHNIGWTAALRAIDRREGAVVPSFTQDFVLDFEPRRDAFFARIVKQWELGDSLAELVDALLSGKALASPATRLGPLLAEADRVAMRKLLPVQ